MDEYRVGPVTIPRWALVALYVSRLAVSPLFLVPFTPLTILALLKAQSTWQALALVVATGLVLLAGLTANTARRMRAEGVLDTYLEATLYTTVIGRLLLRRFDRAHDH